MAIELDEQSLTYNELLFEVQQLSSYLINKCVIKIGDIIFQCVERSIEMCVGILSILSCGGVYFPLNPSDPEKRLQTISSSINSGRLLLLHTSTKEKLHGIKLDSIDIVHVLSDGFQRITDDDLHQLSDICVTSEDIFFMVSTSGTTGQPKYVAHQHKSLLAYTQSYLQLNMQNRMDTTLQIAASSWVIHVSEIIPTFVIGGTLIMLKHHGNMNMKYLIHTIKYKQVSTMTISSTLIRMLCEYLQSNVNADDYQCMTTIRRCSLAAENLSRKTVSLLSSYMTDNVQICNNYGMTECFLVMLYQIHEPKTTTIDVIPIGSPLSHYRCYLLDEQQQLVTGVEEIGEIYVSGAGLFKEYFNDPETTKKVFMVRDGNLLFKTGDLAKYNSNGDFIYVVRTDFQVKIHGQRIETQEIEKRLLSSFNHITDCLIVKYNHDDEEYLIAYVQSSSIENTSLLKIYCQQHLPSYMVPSHFVVLEKFPLNPNGKLDRRQLPPPDFSEVHNEDKYVEPQTEMEQQIHDQWCQILRLSKISTKTNFYSLGGNSLLFMKVFNYYQLHFVPNQNLNISDYLRQPTIKEHAALVLLYSASRLHKTEWVPMGLTAGRASYAQERIWFDEQIRFQPEEQQNKRELAVYQILWLCQVTQGAVSIPRLHHAISLIVKKHPILRTSLSYDSYNQYLKQVIQPLAEDNYSFQKSTIRDNDDDLKQVLYDEETNSSHFNIKQGQVFRYHVIKRRSTINNEDEDLLMENDLIVFSMHHIIFDGGSRDIFFKELQLAYTNGRLDENLNSLNYIDYAQYERQMDMLQAKQRWLQLLDGYDLDKKLSLPYDYKSKERTGRGSIVQFELNHLIVQKMFQYAQETKISTFELMITCLYLLIYKITNYDQDLCIGVLCRTRYRTELEQLLGLFTNVVPYRFNLSNSNTITSFSDLISFVFENCRQILQYSYVPLQEIVHQQQKAGIDFQLILNYQYIDEAILKFDDGIMQRQMPTSMVTSRGDFLVHIDENINTQKIQCAFEYSTDLFQRTTIETMTQQFQLILDQLFIPSSPSSTDKSIYELSILLPHELLLIHNLNDMYFGIMLDASMKCFYQQFAERAQEHPQKLSIVLETQSLTYAEVLFYVQLLCFRLINEYNVTSQQIVCQCVNRSIEMCIGMMAIQFIGCCYCPLHPQDPINRLLLLINQVQPFMILTHSNTSNKFPGTQVVNIERIIHDFCTSNNEQLAMFADIKLDQLAYILFTSGSTGQPKGVQITQRSFLSYIKSIINEQLINSSDIVIQLSTDTSDVHIQEVYGSMSVGSVLVLLKPNGNLDVQYLIKTIEQQQITVINIVPSFILLVDDYLKQQQLRNGSLQTLRIVGAGSEQLTPKTASKLFSRLPARSKFYNIYGTTETTIDCTYHLINEYDLQRSSIPIGRPLSHCKCYILDIYLQSVGINQIGELIVAGIGLFAGYLSRPDLTEQVLIQLPNVEGKCYRTGDLCKIASNGEIVYIDRRDFQVKIRGQRVETGEIEQTIMKSSMHVSDCLVIKHTDNEKQEHLVAYIQQSSSIVDKSSSQIRSYCQLNLPRYMVPSLFIILDQFPLNLTQKIDRHRLPKPDFSQISSLDDHVEPRTSVEKYIHDVWCRILSRKKISVMSNFFTSGGSSMTAMKLYWLYKSSFGFDSRQLHVGMLFKYPTIEQQAHLLLSAQSNVVVNDSCSFRLIENNLLKIIMELDSELPSNMFEMKDIEENFGDKNDILLTGVNGFLGIYLLNELLCQTRSKNIYCLTQSSFTDIIDSLKEFDLYPSYSMERIMPIEGDLSKHQLGLTGAQWLHLSQNIGKIYHCGEIINHVAKYEDHHSINVNGTLAIVRLATTNRMKTLNYISTLDVATNEMVNGYVQSKYVGECIVQQAHDQLELDARIFRLAMISWCTKTGCYNKQDRLCRLVASLINMGIAPDTNVQWNLISVDCASQKIVELGEQPPTVGALAIYNLMNSSSNMISLKTIWTTICQLINKQPEYMDYDEWKRILIDKLQQEPKNINNFNDLLLCEDMFFNISNPICPQLRDEDFGEILPIIIDPIQFIKKVMS